MDSQIHSHGASAGSACAPERKVIGCLSRRLARLACRFSGNLARSSIGLRMQKFWINALPFSCIWKVSFLHSTNMFAPRKLRMAPERRC